MRFPGGPGPGPLWRGSVCCLSQPSHDWLSQPRPCLSAAASPDCLLIALLIACLLCAYCSLYCSIGWLGNFDCLLACSLATEWTAVRCKLPFSPVVGLSCRRW